MKIRAFHAVLLAVVLSSCATSTSTAPPSLDSDSPHPVVTSSQVNDPYWITVTYRSTPVNVGNPRFTFLSGGSSSLVDRAFYDARNRYMIISLNGSAYHYCGMPSSAWSAFGASSSLGRFYNAQIRGRYDCRNGFVPDY